MQNKKQAFTLVELIVVITILAILGTIAFISLQGYSAQARDSRRVSDIGNIKKSLELFSVNTGKYPSPDNGEIVSYSGETVWLQGTIGDNVAKNLGKNLNTKPIDPLTETEYTYSVINTQTKYELLSIYESDLVSYNNLLNYSNAADNVYPKIDGNYNGVFVKTPNYYIPTPSIINSEVNGTGVVLNSDNIKSQIITGGDNIIKNGTNIAKTGLLTNFSLQVYNGTITKDSTIVEKQNLVNVLKLAYSGTILATQDLYKEIIETPTQNYVSLIDSLVLNSATYTPSSSTSVAPTITGLSIEGNISGLISLNESFDGENVFDYTSTIGETDTQVTINVSKSADCVITSSGSNITQTGDQISFPTVASGNYSITITLTSTDGSNNYNLTFAKPSNTDLASLNVKVLSSTMILSPGFSSSTYNYSTTVTNNFYINASSLSNDSTMSLKIGDAAFINLNSGTNSATIPITSGSSVVVIVRVNSNVGGIYKDYTVTVIRP